MRVYKRGAIYWVAYYDASAGEHKRVSTKLSDRSAAESIGRRLERDGADPDGAAAATARLDDALDAVIGEYEQLQREGVKTLDTVEFYRKRAGQLLRMIADGILPERLAELRPKHVDSLIDRRRTEGVKRHTIQKDLITLRLALKLAKRRGMWRGDLDEMLPSFGSGYTPKERVLDMVELARLLAELRSDRASWIAFAVATGANYSEAAKARRTDIKEDRVHLRGTKRETRDRYVPIAYPWQRRLLDGALSAAGADRLFKPWTNSNMARDLEKACSRASLARLSSNDLRRTFGTWMRASGAPIDLLAAALGHADSRMAERVYARLDVSQLGALLSGSTVSQVYVDPVDRPDSVDRADTSKRCVSAEIGSSCWTRTSDPVINSHLQTCGILPTWLVHCASDVREPQPAELPGLAKSVRLVGLDWDAFDRFAAGGEA